MQQRYLNKNLQKAIARGDLFWWSFGTFRTYYTGFILRALRGHKDNGDPIERVVFTTVSIQGAEEIRKVLAEKGIVADFGWGSAVARNDDYQKYGRFIGEPESIRF